MPVDDYQTYAAFYDFHARGVPGDVAFYVDEARRAGAPVLELACGTGRITLPIAEAGVDIVGLDLSPEMLALARVKLAVAPAEVQRRVQLIPGDMRTFALEQRFRLIAIPFRAFLHLLTVEDQRAALARIRAHLADGGRLIFNVFDPRLDILAAHATALGSALKYVDEFVHPITGHKVIVWDTRQYDQTRQIIEQYFIFEEVGDHGQVVAKTYSPLTLRYCFRYELQHLLALCGFEVEALYGDFGRGPFRPGGEQIWVARPA